MTYKARVYGKVYRTNAPVQIVLPLHRRVQAANPPFGGQFTTLARYLKKDQLVWCSGACSWVRVTEVTTE